MFIDHSIYLLNQYKQTFDQFDFVKKTDTRWGSDLSLYGNNGTNNNTIYIDETKIKAAQHKSYNRFGS